MLPVDGAPNQKLENGIEELREQPTGVHLLCKSSCQRLTPFLHLHIYEIIIGEHK